MKRVNYLIAAFVVIFISSFYFMMIHLFQVPFSIQLIMLLVPFFVALRYGVVPALITALLISVAFLHRNPPQQEMLPWYFILLVVIVTGGIIGGIIREYRSQNRKLAALYKAAQLLASMKSLEEVSREVVEILEKVLGYQHAAILWVKNGQLELAYAKDYVQRPGMKIKIGEGVTGTAVKRRLPLIVNDVKKFPNYIPGLHNARSELACPIRLRDKVIGVINIEAREKGAFTKEDLELIEAFSRIVAVAWENATLHEKLFNEAITDPLTGLYNRRYFFKRLQEELLRAQRYGSKFGLLILDLKDFKKINDTYGHERGDEILKAFAEKLQSSVRKIDIVARYGGDEFVVLLTQANRNGVKAVVKRLAKAISEIDVDGIKIQANIGAAIYPEDGTTPDALLRVADDRMYQAKKQNLPFILPWEEVED